MDKVKELWAKRFLLLVVVSILIMGVSGHMDFDHPFRNCYSCGLDAGQVWIFLLSVAAGSLIWHFADERKK